MTITDREAGARHPLTRTQWGAFIDGAFVASPDLPTFTVVEPSTAAPLAEVVAGDAALVDRAVRSARAALPAWRALSGRQRGGYLKQVAERIRAHADELAELVSRENGKPKRDALANDVSFSSNCFEFFAGLGDSLPGEIIDQGPIETRVLYEPYGVVAAILPFNWPPIHFAKKGAPALITGNTVVIKPGEQAPLTVLRLVEIANEVLPPGVLNAVPGIEAGAALAGHPLVERISFTGATATGRRVLQTAAQNLTYATMELGGKNALIVFDDADLELAVTISIEGMFYNQGEACTSTARILVHDAVYDEFVARFTAAATALVVGDGLDPRTDVGPLVDARQRDRVRDYLQTALDEGARVAGQGTIPTDDVYADGYWFAPTVLVDVAPDSTVGQEEIFGPVALIMRYSSIDEAVDIANGTSYGLTAAMITRDEGRAWHIAQRLEAGMVFVNNYMRRSFLGSPFGGVKGSGFGRENAPETLHEFVRSKAVRFPSGRGDIPVWPPRA
jgi:acyl-CoA reductase-like NAD-dependent aldehyde dehydrogenase